MLDFKKIWKEMRNKKDFYALYVASPFDKKIVLLGDDYESIIKSCDDLNKKFAKNRKYFTGYYAFVKKADEDIYTKFPTAREIINALAIDYMISKDVFKTQWKNINKIDDDYETREPADWDEDEVPDQNVSREQYIDFIINKPITAYLNGIDIETIKDVLYREGGYSDSQIKDIISEVLSEARRLGGVDKYDYELWILDDPVNAYKYGASIKDIERVLRMNDYTESEIKNIINGLKNNK